MSNIIVCPHCSEEIPIAEALGQAVHIRLGQEREQLVRQAQFQARQAIAVEVETLHEQLTETTSKLREARDLEAQLRKDRRSLEEQQRELHVQLQRTLDEERAKIRDDALRLAEESHRLKEADQSKLIDALRKQIGDLQRKAEQTSTHIQGEVMEMELEDFLRSQFPHDEFEPVPDASRGADLVQRVRDSQGNFCGTILWESKRTKSWQDAWLQKLKDDQTACRADLAVLFSAQLPKGISTFGCADGVWVTGRGCLHGVAAALRAGLIEVARTRRSLDNRQSKADYLVEYFTSTTFRLKIEGIVETYQSLKDDLIAEKRQHQRMWNKRETHLERAMNSIEGICGELDGMLGAAIPVLLPREVAAVGALENSSPF